MRYGEKVPTAVADFSFLKWYLDGEGLYRVMNIVYSKTGLEISKEGIRKIRARLEKEFEELVKAVKKYAHSKNFVLKAISEGTLNVIDLLLSDISASFKAQLIRVQFKLYSTLAYALFTERLGAHALVSNARLFEMFTNYVELEENIEVDKAPLYEFVSTVRAYEESVRTGALERLKKLIHPGFLEKLTETLAEYRDEIQKAHEEIQRTYGLGENEYLFEHMHKTKNKEHKSMLTLDLPLDRLLATLGG